MPKAKKRKEILVIGYPSQKKIKAVWMRQYSLNAIYSGKHWRERKMDRLFWHGLVEAELRKQGIPCKLFERPVQITFFWGDDLDIDNHSYIGKMIVDALKGRLLADDDKKRYVQCSHSYQEENGIKIIIEEV